METPIRLATRVVPCPPVGFAQRTKLAAKSLLAFALSMLIAVPLWAALTGDLQGTVMDPNGAVVEGAKVSVKSKATGVVRELSTNEHGLFAALQLEIGSYEVRVEKTGFRVATLEVDIRSGEQTRVNVGLELGAVTESVMVEGASGPQLDVSTAQISNSFTSREILDLPNLTRDPLQYATFSAGVVPVSKDNPFLGSGSYNSNGQRGRGNNITVDESTATDISTTGSSGTGTFSLESVQEVKLITNNFSAEFGRNSGSQYQIITKSGTNEYHGTAYWYHQNAAFNARDFFDPFTPEHPTGQVTPFIQNQWGFTAAGPVIKNHLFAFGEYGGIKTRGAGSTSFASVMTPAEAAAITDPTSLALFNAVGAPTDPSGQLASSAPNASDQYFWNLKVDEVFRGGKDSITAKYGTNPVTQVSPSLTFVSSFLPNYGANVVVTDRIFTFGYTHTFSPSVVNQFRFAFGRSNPTFAAFTTLPEPFAPQLQIGGLDFLGVSNIIPQGRVQNTFVYSDSLSYSRGRHNWKFGFEAERYQANSFFDANFRGTFAYSDLASFQSGTPLQYTARFGTSVRGNRATDFSGYVQDDWRITNALTLNLGTRIESSGGVSEINGLLSNLDPNSNAPLGGGGTGPLGSIVLGGTAFNRNTNWAPRVGLAWNPGGKSLVLRAGYGWAYDYIFLNPITNLRFSPPFVTSATVTTFTGNNTYAQLAAGNGQAQQDAIAAIGTFPSTQKNFGAVSPVDPGLSNPRADQWSAGVEYQLLRDFLVKASYVGTKGNRLLISRQANFVQPGSVPAPAASEADEAARLSSLRGTFLGETGNASGTVVNNRLDPRFNSITQVQSAGGSIYHAFQLDVSKRFTHGYQFKAAYTYGHAIDDASDVLNVLVNDSAALQDPRNLSLNRGNSQFDLRHRLVLSHVWELPIARHSTGFVKKAFGGWAFSGDWSIQSGFKSTILAGSRRGVSDVLLVGASTVRADLVGSLGDFKPAPSGSAAADAFHNNPTNPADPFSNCSRGVNTSTSAATICTNSINFPFTQPLLGNAGTMGRNSFPLAGFQIWDWALTKDTKVTERVGFQFRWEVTNVFNHANFSGFSNILTAGNFGEYTSTASDSRRMQAALKITF